MNNIAREKQGMLTLNQNQGPELIAQFGFKSYESVT